ncbi:hypothetical protein C8Q74DRAFT_1255775 [Fomes fomentarius]|nr:hypothetical protein C8Q74DRAFT_1255775 [Fomes fomentarius]
MQAPDDHPTSPIPNTLGAHMLGTFIGAILYGVVLRQTYRYVRLFPTDTLQIRILVSTVLVLVTIHTILTMQLSYFFAVTNHAQLVSTTEWVFGVNVVLTTVIWAVNVNVSQSIFLYRVFLMGRLYRIVASVATLSFISEIAVVIYGFVKIMVRTYRTTQNEISSTKYAFTWNLVIITVGDSLLTGALIAKLYSTRNTRSSERTSKPISVVDTIVTYVVNTGLLHWALNLASSILQVQLPSTTWSQAVNNVTTKVYAITLLTVLNTRNLSFSQGAIVFESGQQYGNNIIARADSLAAQERWNVPHALDSAPPVISVNISTEMEDERNAHWFKRSKSSISIESVYTNHDDLV